MSIKADIKKLIITIQSADTNEVIRKIETNRMLLAFDTDGDEEQVIVNLHSLGTNEEIVAMLNVIIQNLGTKMLMQAIVRNDYRLPVFTLIEDQQEN